MKSAIVAFALVLAVLLAAGSGYYVGISNQRTITSVSVSTVLSTPTASAKPVTSTTPSVQLFAAVTPAIAPVGENVSIVAGIYNPLQSQVALNFTESLNPSEGPCYGGPVFIWVFSGHHTFANLSRASPLLIWNASNAVPCFKSETVSLTFAPNSDRALAVSQDMVYDSAWTINYTTVLSGYWINCCVAGPGSSYTYERFQPGPYTVLVFDAWSQQVIEYFEVT
jgi:hypothetical protein